MKLWVNITTEDGELLERVEVEVHGRDLVSAYAKAEVTIALDDAARYLVQQSAQTVEGP